MNFFRSALLAVALVALASCAKKQQPSAEYAQAQQLWTVMVQDNGLEAHADPRAEQVLELLGRVAPDSLDAQAAAELKKRIETERADAKKAAEERAAMIEAAATPPPMPAGFAQETVTEAAQPAEPETPAAPAAAEPVDETQPKEGMQAGVFKQKFGRCFEYKNAFGTPTGQSGDVFGLKDLSLCREQHPNFVTQSVLLMDGKVASIRSNEELKPVKYKLVGGKLVPFEGEEAAKPAPAMAADSTTE